ncbi:hypothetical protein PGT21_020096 [Puccinia graminis f. sp. tritici]|uniref:HAT C-terminal dimerisation domain-containing protein n=1 Tax=Puccinia graminis f. sp. tritici TaxID=56615 RepID=A0A5B0M322_PUCGR|nr:hypothetical protein PGT21_020096 [Puccinia graminis f. sp. tritici]KAA1125806.1 hypothetical protein PGTUg99_022684 [Puccinia graminis f. sp. tritici]
MEGNSSTGTHVLTKYLELKQSLTTKIEASLETSSLYPMYQAMLKRVKKYLNEAIDEAVHCLKRLQKEYNRTKENIKSNKPPENTNEIVEVEKPLTSLPGSLMACVASKMSKQKDNPQSNKIKAYLKAELFFKEDNLDHKTTPLIKWWRANKTTYPTLAIIARGSNRGRLLPSTHSVSSLMWLREEVPLTRDFLEAGKAFKALIPHKK